MEHVVGGAAPDERAARGGQGAPGGFEAGRFKASLLVSTMIGLAVLGTQPAIGAESTATTGGTANKDAATTDGKGATVLAPVSVEGVVGGTEGYVATRSAVGTKTETPLIEIPQTISVVTRKELDQRAVQDFNGAVAYSPGISVVDYPGGPGAPDFSMRGFRDFNLFGIYRDGLRAGFNNYDTTFEPYGLDRVDVVKGPASVLFGQTSPGGVVNLTSKRPTDVPLHEIQLQTGSYDRRQGAFDFGGPVDDGGKILYRFTGLGRLSDTQVDHAPDDRLYLAPAVTFKPGDTTKVTLLGSYQKIKISGAEQSIPRSSMDLIGTDLYFGIPHLSNWEAENTSIGYEVSHELSDNWSLHQNARYMHSRVDFYSAYSMAWPVELQDGHYYPIGVQYRPKVTNTYLLDTNVQGKVVTGPVTHNLLAGADYSYYTAKETRRNSTNSLLLDIFNPNYGGTTFEFADPWVNGKSELSQFGVYLQDQLHYDNWVLTLNGRQDWVVDKEIDYLSDSFQTARDHDFTGRVGLGYVFDNGIAPYASYSTSFQPSTGTYAPERGGGTFKPTTGTQYEVGVKYQPNGWNSFITASLYQITQQNVSTNDPVYSGYTVQDGEIRSRGFELEGKAELTENLSLIASYAFVSAKITKDNPAVGSTTSSVGLQPKGIPRNMASAWADYTIKSGELNGLGFGLGARYIGESKNTANTETIPDYTLVDAAVRYDLGALKPQLAGASVALNVTNLFDKKYYSAGFYDNTVLYGNRRQILATVKYTW